LNASSPQLRWRHALLLPPCAICRRQYALHVHVDELLDWDQSLEGIGQCHYGVLHDAFDLELFVSNFVCFLEHFVLL
ncbi:hypothetical protein KCV07_g71, partial [Aureobasidium melanogenum]